MLERLAGAFLQPRETGFYDHEMCAIYCDFRSKNGLEFEVGNPLLEVIGDTRDTLTLLSRR
jgi:hypothetical protein